MSNRDRELFRIEMIVEAVSFDRTVRVRAQSTLTPVPKLGWREQYNFSFSEKDFIIRVNDLELMQRFMRLLGDKTAQSLMQLNSELAVEQVRESKYV